MYGGEIDHADQLERRAEAHPSRVDGTDVGLCSDEFVDCVR